MLLKLIYNLIKKETPTQVYFCEFSEFLKTLLQNIRKWLVLNSAQF